MKKAIIRGYYGMQNTGDDAFLTVSAWAAKHFLQVDRIQATAAEIPSNLAAQVEALYPGLRLRGIGRFNALFDLWQSARRPDWVIWGGGSNFHSEDLIKFWLKTLKLSPRTRCFAAGVSIGPFKHVSAEKACGELLNRMEFVGVRDVASLERARAIAPGARIELTFDIAPLMRCVTNGESAVEDRNGLGIALCNYERFVNGDVQREMARSEIVASAVKRLVKEGITDKVVLIDFSGHPRMGDHQVHNDLKCRLEDFVTVRHIHYASDAAVALKTITSLKAIIAMRLHAAVYAYIANTPALILGYHEKCFEWAKMIQHRPELVLDTNFLEVETLIQKLTLLITSKDNILPGLRVEEAISRGMRNWNWLTA